MRRTDSPGKAVVDVADMTVVCYGQSLERRCKCLAILLEREQLGTELYFVAVENDVEQGQARACVVYHLQ